MQGLDDSDKWKKDHLLFGYILFVKSLWAAYCLCSLSFSECFQWEHCRFEQCSSLIFAEYCQAVSLDSRFPFLQFSMVGTVYKGMAFVGEKAKKGK